MKPIPLIAPFALLAALGGTAHGQALVASNVTTDSTPARPARTEHADSSRSEPKKKEATESPALFGLKLSGYIETSFNHSNRPNGAVIADRLFEQANDHVALNGVRLSVEREIKPAHFSLGFHADALFGDNAHYLQSPGYDFGKNGDLYQAFVTINVPTKDGFGLQVKAGRIATFLGVEQIESPFNPNVSEGHAFYYAENFTQTGISVEHRFSEKIDAQVRAFRGWDQIVDNNNRYSYMARLGVTPSERTSLAFAVFTGPERANNDNAMRSGVQVIATHKVGRVTYAVQGDVGMEQRNADLPDPTKDASWWAGSGWMTVEANSHLSVALRGDYFSDRGASRTSDAFGLTGAPNHRLASATATLNVKVVPSVLLRPEVRYDRTNLSDFASFGNQVTFGMGAVYLF
jgi:hypothetical protein